MFESKSHQRSKKITFQRSDQKKEEKIISKLSISISEDFS